MYEAFHSYMSWWQFLVIAIILVSVFYILNRFKHYIFKFTKLDTLYYPNLILVILFLLAFILVNPLFNGFIFLICLILFYPVISSFLKGMIAFNNMKLKQGEHIKINHQEGKISEVSFSGVKLATGSNNIYIPFGKLAENIVERYEQDQIQYLCLLCHSEDGAEKLNKNIVEKLLFNFPFLEHKSKIEIQQVENGVKVNVSLADNRFRYSLIEKFADVGIKVELTKNN